MNSQHSTQAQKPLNAGKDFLPNIAFENKIEPKHLKDLIIRSDSYKNPSPLVKAYNYLRAAPEKSPYYLSSLARLALADEGVKLPLGVKHPSLSSEDIRKHMSNPSTLDYPEMLALHPNTPVDVLIKFNAQAREESRQGNPTVKLYLAGNEHIKNAARYYLENGIYDEGKHFPVERN